MRKYLSLFSLVLTFLVGIATLAPATANAETYLTMNIDGANRTLRAAEIKLNGVTVPTDVPAVTYHQRSIIPFRALGEAMGAEISWDEHNWIASMSLNGKKIDLKIDSNIAVVDGVEKPISYNMPAKLVNARTMIPVRFIAEEFGFNVDWDAPNYTVLINTDEVSYVPPAEAPVQPEQPAQPAGNNGKTVVIDAGHGGHDPGAISTTGKQEKVLALNVAQKTERILKERGYNVVMTRNADYFVGLSERAQISDNVGADIFVSIHFNAAAASSATGLETFYFPGSGEGGRLAGAIQDELINNVGGVQRGIKTAKFTVISETACIAVLTELGFITNPVDEPRLVSDQYHEESALAIANGVDRYFGLR